MVHRTRREVHIVIADDQAPVVVAMDTVFVQRRIQPRIVHATKEVRVDLHDLSPIR
jgi:hypothetical protein